MAGNQIASLAENVDAALHPMTLLRMAYDL
jgi:hypothetical protein